MKASKIKTSATLVAQFPAGMEVNVIEHEGKLYLPVVDLASMFEASKDVPQVQPSVAAPAASSKPADKPAAKPSVKKYTEDELMEMDSKDLEKMLRKEYGVDPDEFDGKNTNKKLRLLILEQQDKVSDEAEETADDAPESSDAEEAPEAKEEASDEEQELENILDEYDNGRSNRKKTLAALVEIIGEDKSDKIEKILDEFEDDSDAPFSDFVDKLVALKTGKKPSKKKSSEEKLVEFDDLEVGQRVSVYWDDEDPQWYDGEVKSIKKGKILIAYDDDTEEYLDAEVHTKVKLL